MIKINLLPEERKLKAARETKELSAKKLLLIFPAIAAVLILAHLVLGVACLVRGSQLTFLNAQWQRLEPQRKKVEEARKDIESRLQDVQAAEQLIARRVVWAPKLQSLSVNLPPGVWFNELILARGDLTLRCSVVSLEKEEMGLLSSFIEGLKKDPAFVKDFTGIELGSIQVRNAGAYEVTDFILSGRLKQQAAQGPKRHK